MLYKYSMGNFDCFCLSKENMFILHNFFKRANIALDQAAKNCGSTNDNLLLDELISWLERSKDAPIPMVNKRIKKQFDKMLISNDYCAQFQSSDQSKD